MPVTTSVIEGCDVVGHGMCDGADVFTLWKLGLRQLMTTPLATYRLWVPHGRAERAPVQDVFREIRVSAALRKLA